PGGISYALAPSRRARRGRGPVGMSWIPLRLKRRVWSRARGRCEYCGLAQAGQEATFHIDHIIPETRGGATTLENLALACVSCSLRKESREMVGDPQTGRTTA